MFIDNPLTIMLLSLIAGFYFEKFIYMGKLKSKLKCQLRTLHVLYRHYKAIPEYCHCSSVS